MIDDLRIKNAILEEKLMQKMKQARYYKKKYQEAQNTIKEVREYIDRRDIEWGSDEHNHLIKILDKEIKK